MEQKIENEKVDSEKISPSPTQLLMLRTVGEKLATSLSRSVSSSQLVRKQEFPENTPA